jgi:1-acyl-sn-glycerol-3-phosphate acyltransferase
MSYLRLFYRLNIFIVLLILFLLISLSIDLTVKNQHKKRRLFLKNAGIFRDIACRLYKINVLIDNASIHKLDKNYLILSNHLSYLDIIALMYNNKNVFVSTTEVRDSFLIGKLAQYGGSVFIDRKNKNGIKEEIEMIKDLLHNGFNVVIFPEGTTSNGECVLPFKSSFLELAFLVDALIAPCCIKYTKVNNGPVNEKNRDLLYYYGDMEFFSHFFTFLKNVKSVFIEVKFLKPEDPKNFKDRKELSKYLHSKIEKCYKS